VKLPEGEIKEGIDGERKRGVWVLILLACESISECSGHPVCECVLQSLLVVLGRFELECIWTNLRGLSGRHHAGQGLHARHHHRQLWR